MDGFHVKCIAQNERNLVFGAKIGDPVPGKHVHDADHHIFKEKEDDVEQQFGIGLKILMHSGFALLADDAHVHFSCMQIDAAIKFVTLIIKSPFLPPFFAQWVNDRRINSLHWRIKGGNPVRYFPAENGPIKLLVGGRKILGRVIGIYCLGFLLRPQPVSYRPGKPYRYFNIDLLWYYLVFLRYRFTAP
jgi:hypothetical protein